MAAADLRVENCEFQNNSSSNGGAIHNGNNNGGYSDLVLRDCVFKGNTANSGACLGNALRYDTLVVDRCFFTNNLSANSVVVIDDFLSAKVMNSAIIGNSVNGFSSEVLRVNTFASTTSPFDLINCTIAHNRNITTSTLQGEIVQLEDNHMRVSNCILYGNTPYAGRQMRNGPLVRYSLVEGGYASGTAILDADPQFVAPNAGAPSNFDATGFDYTLLGSSPCINAGDNEAVEAAFLLDLALNDRIQGGVVDLGCYESSFSVSLGAEIAGAQSWYFAATERELHIPDAENLRVIHPIHPGPQRTGGPAPEHAQQRGATGPAHRPVHRGSGGVGGLALRGLVSSRARASRCIEVTGLRHFTRHSAKDQGDRPTSLPLRNAWIVSCSPWQISCDTSSSPPSSSHSHFSPSKPPSPLVKTSWWRASLPCRPSW